MQKVVGSTPAVARSLLSCGVPLCVAGSCFPRRCVYLCVCVFVWLCVCACVCGRVCAFAGVWWWWWWCGAGGRVGGGWVAVCGVVVVGWFAVWWRGVG